MEHAPERLKDESAGRIYPSPLARKSSVPSSVQHGGTHGGPNATDDPVIRAIQHPHIESGRPEPQMPREECVKSMQIVNEIYQTETSVERQNTCPLEKTANPYQ